MLCVSETFCFRSCYFPGCFCDNATSATKAPCTFRANCSLTPPHKGTGADMFGGNGSNYLPAGFMCTIREELKFLRKLSLGDANFSLSQQFSGRFRPRLAAGLPLQLAKRPASRQRHRRQPSTNTEVGLFSEVRMLGASWCALGHRIVVKTAPMQR